MIARYSENLSDKQFDIAVRSMDFPVILKSRGECITAASLARNGWGAVEAGASGEKIFRISQEGFDDLEWVREVRAA